MFDFNPEKIAKEAVDNFNKAVKAMPKTPEDVQATYNKLGKVFQTETTETIVMWNTYQKALRGDATANEIVAANKKAQELAISAGFACFLAVPGSFFMLPALVEFAKQNNVELVPASVKKEFNL
jgi:hypothetical protein